MIDSKKILFYTCSLFCFLSCVAPETEDNDLCFFIDGDFPAMKGDTVFLEYINDSGLELMDSSIVDDEGKFSLNSKISTADFYTLRFSDKEKFITLIPDTCQKISLNSKEKDFHRNYSIEGSPESEKICNVVSQLTKLQDITDSLGKIFRASVSEKNLAEIKYSLDSIYEIHYKNLRKFSDNFLKENSNSLTQIVCVSQYINPKTPLYDPEKDLEVYKKVCDNLNDYFPDNYYTKRMIAFLERQKLSLSGEKPLEGVIKKGMKAPDIQLKNQKGETFSLYDLHEKKYIFVSFTASWSDVSKDYNEQLVKVYKKYYLKRFSVYQVWLESRQDSWKKALYEQRIPWMTYSDFKNWNTQAVKDYGVKTLPSNFLLNGDFTVLETDLTVSELERFLEQHLQKK